jgi:hypothetical protein
LALLIALPAGAETPGSELVPAVGQDGVRNPQGQPAAKKKGKKKKKKPRLMKAPAFLGLKGALIPLVDMNSYAHGYYDTEQSLDFTDKIDYDFVKPVLGFGLTGGYRFHRKLSVVAEMMFFFPKVEDVDKSQHPCAHQGDDACDFDYYDAIMDLGIGLRVDILGSGFSKSRLYGQIMIGWGHYFADDDSEPMLTQWDRDGFFWSPVAGFQQLFGDHFSLFIETGLYQNLFGSRDWDNESITYETKDEKTGQKSTRTLTYTDEDHSSFTGWLITIGLMGHWGQPRR